MRSPSGSATSRQSELDRATAPNLAETPTPHSAEGPEQRLGLRPVPVDRWPDYHVNSSRRAHHASAASIALSASGTLSIIQAVATQCRGIWVIIAGRNRRSSGVTGSGAELS